jgi:phosphoribosylaminoimidazole-succinocarboxamide synthase
LFHDLIVRNWLKANWNPSTQTGAESVPPVLPDEIVEQTAARYRELADRLTA